MTKLTTMLAITALSTNLFAGGDIVVPYVPVEPIESTPELTPVFYVGVGAALGGLSRECPCANDSSRLKDLTYGGIVKAGVDVIENLAIEARYINTSIESDFSKVEHYGIYLKPQYWMTDETKVYGLLGYGKTTVDYDIKKRSTTLSESGLAYGAGLEFAVNNQVGIWIDAQHIFSDEGAFGTDLNIGTAGVSYNF